MICLDSRSLAPRLGCARDELFTASESQTVMAFDFGEKRIGVAIGESLLGSARPLASIEAEASNRRFAAIGKLIQEWQPVRLLVGLPRHTDDTEHAFGARCQRFARQLEGRYRLPVDMADERYTSVLAEASLPGDKRKNKLHVDAQAAAILLQDWFSNRK